MMRFVISGNSVPDRQDDESSVCGGSATQMGKALAMGVE
jgi:hypothetical protein